MREVLHSPSSELSDTTIVERVLAGETALFEILMRRHNQRVYRASRAIVRDESEAEDIMQDAYVRAYMHLDQFANRSQFSTWLTKIAIHEALARKHRTSRCESFDETIPKHQDNLTMPTSNNANPERQAFDRELSQILEAAVDSLPEGLRSVFVLRDIEEMSTSETADTLDITEDTVKVRLHRARASLRKDLFARTGAVAVSAFQFHLSRCDRVVAGVFSRIAPNTEGKGD